MAFSGEPSLSGFDDGIKEFGLSATPVYASEQYVNYDFIAVLGLAQRLHIRFLPITPQMLLGQIGEGGQSRINQASANVQISFAFKYFKHSQRCPFREIVQEMVVLSHPVVRRHQHIVRLEGICWDIPNDDQVWPVLVFQKSHLGDLYGFVRRKRFKTLSIEDRLRLCADIGIAIKDMHCNGIYIY